MEMKIRMCVVGPVEVMGREDPSLLFVLVLTHGGVRPVSYTWMETLCDPGTIILLYPWHN